jgi:hypothetical protein
MLLNFLLTIITFRTLPGLNKILNETISINNGTTKIETKMSYIIYTRIVAIVLLLTGLVLLHIISLTFFNINYDAFIIDYTTLTLSTNLIPSALRVTSTKTIENKTEIPSPEKQVGGQIVKLIFCIVITLFMLIFINYILTEYLINNLNIVS